jgi:hypothetical protein
MENDSEEISEVMAYLRDYPGTCLQKLRKTTKISARISDVSTKIRRENLARTSLGRCRNTVI